MALFDKIIQITFFTKSTKASQNRPWKVKRITFFPAIFGKLQNINTLNFTFFKNMGKDILDLKIYSKADHSSWNYGPSNFFVKHFMEKLQGSTLSHYMLWPGNICRENDDPLIIFQNFFKSLFSLPSTICKLKKFSIFYSLDLYNMHY